MCAIPEDLSNLRFSFFLPTRLRLPTAKKRDMDRLGGGRGEDVLHIDRGGCVPGVCLRGAG